MSPGSGVTGVVRIPVNNGPISGIAASPDGSRLLVTNYGRNTVSVIDTGTCRVLETIAGLDEPFAIAIGGVQANRAYVSTVSTAYDSIGVIDLSTNTVIASHPLALSVSDLVVSADGHYVYASRNGADSADVVVLDTATDRLQVIDIAGPAGAPGTTTACLCVSADGGRLYVGTNGPAGGWLVVMAPHAPADDDAGRPPRWRQGHLSRLRGKTRQPGLGVMDAIEIGLPIRDVAVSPNGSIAYVASCDPQFGAVVDFVDTRTNTIIGTRKVGEIGGLLTGLTLSGDGERAYLVSDDSVTVLCTLTHDVIGAVLLAEPPSCVSESSDGKYLYIADYSGAVIVIPVASATGSGFASEPLTRDAAAEWTVPESLAYEAALA
ncbi:YncE family protein [Mycobacterium haemophilum]|uniref:Uncharacterized protein n=1 Tax=Mycobacterium haemophilum TaxID=29311 RepID=A0A0I9Y695_9MYCO|nr:YncE family protein [Mycobacterium haemophilum]KLO27574.1 hypothetical protein ABH39_15795 [Mycobacterium haemophilum]KLO35162.1 hypothetical protein ABH38_16785 [Mycobacterium haemophilum]KLO40152.1 hypothetical protein ABH37_16895 [Mycobacterium haemophilum]KLO47433.1 hypothetical protein ABH36_16710 [Mycobacterium haemophilum]